LKRAFRCLLQNLKTTGAPICFRFEAGNAFDVEIVDYHQGGYCMRKRQVPYPAPGEILSEEFLKPMGLTQYRLAKEIGVSQRRIGEIIAGKRAITTNTGLRLSRFFGLSDGFWERLQIDYDLTVAKDEMAETLKRIKPYAAA
jgi:antitoxin HigA-1